MLSVIGTRRRLGRLPPPPSSMFDGGPSSSVASARLSSAVDTSDRLVIHESLSGTKIEKECSTSASPGAALSAEDPFAYDPHVNRPCASVKWNSGFVTTANPVSSSTPKPPPPVIAPHRRRYPAASLSW